MLKFFDTVKRQEQSEYVAEKLLLMEKKWLVVL